MQNVVTERASGQRVDVDPARLCGCVEGDRKGSYHGFGRGWSLAWLALLALSLVLVSCSNFRRSRAISEVAGLLVQLNELVEILNVDWSSARAIVVDCCTCGYAPTVSTRLFHSLDANVVLLPTGSWYTFCAGTTAIRRNSWSTVVATLMIIGGLHETHAAAMRLQGDF